MDDIGNVVIIENSCKSKAMKVKGLLYHSEQFSEVWGRGDPEQSENFIRTAQSSP